MLNFLLWKMLAFQGQSIHNHNILHFLIRQDAVIKIDIVSAWFSVHSFVWAENDTCLFKIEKRKFPAAHIQMSSL